MKVSVAFQKIRFFILTTLIALFGNWSWQQPGWLIALKANLAKLWQTAKAKPLASFGIVVLLSGITAAGWFGYQWWQNRPQPVRIDFAVTEPERTAIENDEAPHPLVINFNASVAPLDQVGKDIAQGITMKPAILSAPLFFAKAKMGSIRF